MEIRIRINDRVVRFIKGMVSRRFLPFFIALVLAGVTVALLAEPFVIPFAFKAGDVISSAQMNANFTEVKDRVNAISTQVDALTAGGSSLWVSNGTDYYYNAGNVGIGTGTPSSLLHLYSNTGNVGLRVESANVSYSPEVTLGYSGDSNVKLWRDASNHFFKFNVGGQPRLTIDTSGKVGIGTPTPAEMLHLYSGNLYLQGGHLIMDETATGQPYEIYSENNDLIVKQYRAADSNFMIWNSYGNALNLILIKGGVWANAFINNSDARLKENIAPISGALDKITAIEGVSYTLRGSDETRLGVVAQNVQESIPEAVRVNDESTGYLGVDYMALVPVLIEAVKELKSENGLLRQRLDDLEALLQ